MEFNYIEAYMDSVSASQAMRRLKDTVAELHEYIGDAMDAAVSVGGSNLAGKGVFYKGTEVLEKNCFIGIYLGRRTLTREAKKIAEA
jgi:hypothetical protein